MRMLLLLLLLALALGKITITSQYPDATCSGAPTISFMFPTCAPQPCSFDPTAQQAMQSVCADSVPATAGVTTVQAFDDQACSSLSLGFASTNVTCIDLTGFSSIATRCFPGGAWNITAWYPGSGCSVASLWTAAGKSASACVAYEGGSLRVDCRT